MGALQVNPADVPVLELKLGALVVLLCVTLLFGLAPLCIVRGTASCCGEPGKMPAAVWMSWTWVCSSTVTTSDVVLQMCGTGC